MFRRANETEEKKAETIEPPRSPRGIRMLPENEKNRLQAEKWNTESGQAEMMTMRHIKSEFVEEAVMARGHYDWVTERTAEVKEMERRHIGRTANEETKKDVQEEERIAQVPERIAAPEDTLSGTIKQEVEEPTDPVRMHMQMNGEVQWQKTHDLGNTRKQDVNQEEQNPSREGFAVKGQAFERVDARPNGLQAMEEAQKGQSYEDPQFLLREIKREMEEPVQRDQEAASVGMQAEVWNEAPATLGDVFGTQEPLYLHREQEESKEHAQEMVGQERRFEHGGHMEAIEQGFCGADGQRNMREDRHYWNHRVMKSEGASEVYADATVKEEGPWVHREAKREEQPDVQIVCATVDPSTQKMSDKERRKSAKKTAKEAERNAVSAQLVLARVNLELEEKKKENERLKEENDRLREQFMKMENDLKTREKEAVRELAKEAEAITAKQAVMRRIERKREESKRRKEAEREERWEERREERRADWRRSLKRNLEREEQRSAPYKKRFR